MNPVLLQTWDELTILGRLGRSPIVQSKDSGDAIPGEADILTLSS